MSYFSVRLWLSIEVRKIDLQQEKELQVEGLQNAGVYFLILHSISIPFYWNLLYYIVWT